MILANFLAASLAALFLGCLVAPMMLVAGQLQLQQQQPQQQQQHTYLIKGKQVADSTEAVTQLRRFLAAGLSQEARCERLAVLLKLVTERPLDSFQVADIGLANPRWSRDQFVKIDVETLRFLYIEAIDRFRQAQQIDDGLLELVQCLSDKYRSVDARALSYLNDPELKQILEQYRQITGQPLRLLVAHGARRHPELGLDQLHPAIRRMVASWLAGDQARADQIFERAARPTTPKPEPRPQPTKLVVVQQPPVQAQAVAFAGGAPPQPQPQPQVPRVQPAPPVKATPSQQVEAQPPIVSASEPQVVDNQQQQQQQQELSEAEAKYLGHLIGSIIEAYQTLPVETNLPDRCQTYGRILEADTEQLYTDTFVGKLVGETASKLEAGQVLQGAYTPDKDVRDDFLMVANAYDPLETSPEVWFELNDCISQWHDLDETVSDYLNSPARLQLAEQLMALPVEGEGQEAPPEVGTQPPSSSPSSSNNIGH